MLNLTLVRNELCEKCAKEKQYRQFEDEEKMDWYLVIW